MRAVQTTEVRSAATNRHGQVEDRTYEAIRELVVTGRLRPGERAVETRLAKRLGVSRTPVRAAIARLAREGFLAPATKGRRIEYTAAPLSVGDMRELWSIIGALERLAVGAVDRMSESEQAELADGLASINRELAIAASARPRDPERLAELQGAFHASFVDRCAGPHLRKLHRAVRPHLRRYEWAYGARTEAPYGPSIDEHDEIVGALRTGDGGLAGRLISRHWRQAAERTAAIMKVVVEDPN